MKSIHGFARATADFKEENDLHRTFFRHLMGTKVNIQKDAALVSKQDIRALTPVVFSHGNTSNKLTHTCTAREMASNGCIVFILNHHDTSCDYYVCEEGED
jgi:hypothetical protein